MNKAANKKNDILSKPRSFPSNFFNSIHAEVWHRSPAVALKFN